VRFAGFSETCVDIPAHMAWNDLAHNAGRRLTDLEREGACTWYFWPGGDPLATGGDPADARGNPRFWRRAEVRTAEIAEATGLRVGLNLVDFVDSRRRAERFAELGLVNDPNCTAADEPDAYGLWLDRCRDPYSSGILGIRLFPNPAFEAASWDPERFLDPRRTAADAAIEPPYLAGLTCAVCHVAFNPVNPPRDPERPGWENLAPAFGNQFLREGEMFKAGLSEEDFLYHVFDGQQPGTSDTSRISVDWINNPNAINPIFFIASVRPAWEEEMADGTVRRVPRVLKDGADSVGLAQAALRVYVNIGTCGDYRSTLEDAFTGLEPQRPFDVKHAAAECADWRLTAGRMKGAAAFLDAVRPYRLADAPGGERHLTADAETLALGKRAFAAHCTRCHSSKLPPGLTHEGDAKHLPAAVPAWTELVLRPDFLDDNFLSDDRRYPLVSDNPYRAIGTNAARALATNARAGHLWQGFSSATYKALPSPGMLTLNDPFGGGEIAFEVPAGGNGWYRTPSLVNLWATAPFLHNNALGLYNHDPSVDGRIAAYEDAAEKLLWPERRLGERSIKRTPRDTVLRFRTLDVRVPAGTPVNLLANLDLRRAAADEARLARLEALLEGPSHLGRLAGGGELARELLALNQAPDFVEDHGHTHHGSLTDGEKRALIEYMKTF
jgi:mono/diheme cytochrome c family protein